MGHLQLIPRVVPTKLATVGMTGVITASKGAMGMSIASHVTSPSGCMMRRRNTARISSSK